MTAPIHCRACPFAGCVWCEFKGGVDANPVAAQTDADHTTARETPVFDTLGSVSETAPTEARQRFNRGLTTDSTPD